MTFVCVWVFKAVALGPVVGGVRSVGRQQRLPHLEPPGTAGIKGPQSAWPGQLVVGRTRCRLVAALLDPEGLRDQNRVQ